MASHCKPKHSKIMTHNIKYWFFRVIAIMVISFIAYSGGEMLDRATATAETEFCENDMCINLFNVGYCYDAPGSKRGCNKLGVSCDTYRCGGPNDGKTDILQ